MRPQELGKSSQTRTIDICKVFTVLVMSPASAKIKHIRAKMALHVGQYEQSILLRYMTMTTTQVIPRSARSLAAEQNACLFGLKNLM